MNEKVRAYLIEVARIGNKFVYYSDVVKDCRLGIDLATQQGRDQLSMTLGDISTYEDKHGRPLLSSLVFYKIKNDHGDGFYKLAVSLKKGKFKKLKDDLFAFEEAKKCQAYWQNELQYKQNAKLSESNTYSNVTSNYFTLSELNYFSKYKNQPYDPENPENVAAKNEIMDSVWRKSGILGELIINQIQGFDIEKGNYWHQRGWKTVNGKNIPTTVFKPYTWVKIYRKEDKDKYIYFTFGINAEQKAFIYKIDCRNNDEQHLSKAQVNICLSLIPESAKWNDEIDYDGLVKHNWKSLTQICVDFINNHLDYYDAIVKAVWEGSIPANLFKDTLVLREKPKDGITEINSKDRSFNGRDIDFTAKSNEQKELGDLGENLVMQREINYLNENDLPKLVSRVRKAKDGEGYDILSFSNDGSEKYIEVKTTTGNQYTPFFLTENEKTFMSLHKNSYFIYRVYHYDVENNFGDYFILEGNVEDQLILQPTNYRVFLKKEE